MPEEVRFVARLGIYGVAIAVIYWFISYEVAGSILLLAFGLATAFAAAYLLLDVRRTGRGAALGGRPWQWLGLAPTEDEAPFGDETGRLPGQSIAPLEFGFGAAVAGLGLVFGPWLVALGLVPMVVGGTVWLREAMAEHHALDLAEREGLDLAEGQAAAEDRPAPDINRGGEAAAEPPSAQSRREPGVAGAASTAETGSTRGGS
jgi:hypothetical protein